MAGFLYFLANAHAGLASREMMVAHGLGYAFPRVNGECPTACWESPGPDNQRGTMVAYGDDPRLANPQLVYDPQIQDWHQVSEKVWLGCAKDPALRPLAGDLWRGKRACVEGYPVELGDGGQWIVPIVRRFPDGSALPQVLIPRADGSVVARQRREYEELFALAVKFTEELYGGGNVVIPREDSERYAEMVRCCVLALQVNYRVGPIECAALELLDEKNIGAVAEAITDFPSLKKLAVELKKKQAAESEPGATSSTGASASPDTAPPGPKSVSIVN